MLRKKQFYKTFSVLALSGSAQSAVIQRQHDGYGHAGAIQPKRHERRQPMQPGTVYASDVGRRCGRRRRCTGRPILEKKQVGADPAYHRRCDALRQRHGGRDVPDRAAGAGAASESSIQCPPCDRVGRPLFSDRQLDLYPLYGGQYSGGVPAVCGDRFHRICDLFFYPVYQYLPELPTDLRQLRFPGAWCTGRCRGHTGLPLY